MKNINLNMILTIFVTGATLVLFQNCGRVRYMTDVNANSTNAGAADGTEGVADCTTGGANGTAVCAGKTVYFIGGVAQVFGDSSKALDGSKEIILTHPFNGKNSRVKILMNRAGKIEVRPADGYYPWACIDHTKAIDALLQHKNRDGSPGAISGNCYSPIRWYTDDGQQGFAKDINNVAISVQKNSLNEVYRRATPNELGVYVTNMVLAPPDRFNKDGSLKNLIWVSNPTPSDNFMMDFTQLYSGVFPYPENATHLMVYDYKAAVSLGSAWTSILIENNSNQLAAARAQGYVP